MYMRKNLSYNTYKQFKPLNITLPDSLNANKVDYNISHESQNLPITKRVEQKVQFQQGKKFDIDPDQNISANGERKNICDTL